MNKKRKRFFLLFFIFIFLTLTVFQNSFFFKDSKEAETTKIPSSMQEIIGKLFPGKIVFSKERSKKNTKNVKTTNKTIERAEPSKRRRAKKIEKEDKTIEKKKIIKQDGEKKKKKVYLTFDDGPSENTDEVLKILDEYGVKGTFFVIGKEDKDSLRRYKDIVKKGHTIALHSYTHNYKQIYAGLDAFKKDFKRISDLIYDVTGVRSKYYRFPGGTSNTVSPSDMNIFVNYLNKEGIRYYDWNVLNQDADGKFHSPNQLYYNVINPIRRSKEKAFIVLMHDSEPKKNTVKALPKVLETLLKDGYQLLPIDDETVQIHHAIHKKR